MEKNRGTKVIAIVALLVGILGLSLGFAAFSNTLSISSGASVMPNASTFDVDFSSSDTALATDAIAPTLSPTTLSATNASISNTGNPKISGMSVEFTEPGQSATYTFYATNKGEYDAFLKSITYANVTGQNAPKICTPGAGTDNDLVQTACTSISLSVKVGDEAATTGSVETISDHELAKGAYEPIVVVINYASNGARADGDFTVSFGDVSLSYNSVD